MTPAQHELQAIILSLFSKALGQPVTAQDDFFAIGGDSLAAEQVLAGLSAAVSQDLPGWMLLDHPSAETLAQALCP
ncbi:phosphopantetheine-binding protein [Cypionkella sinensis]|uniref:phosphopantetheine-binding protein n=1 Tax=Cypionkella sinensis TaxID=1756043 RepID=UPI00363AC4EB